jgi:hypothetical protein
MPAYKYHEEWMVSYRYDCTFFVTSRSLRDALWIAALRNEDSLISGKAEVELDGEKKAVAVGVRLSEIKGRTFNEIYALLDQKISAHLESLRARGLGLDRSV